MHNEVGSMPLPLVRSFCTVGIQYFPTVKLGRCENIRSWNVLSGGGEVALVYKLHIYVPGPWGKKDFMKYSHGIQICQRLEINIDTVLSVGKDFIKHSHDIFFCHSNLSAIEKEL